MVKILRDVIITQVALLHERMHGPDYFKTVFMTKSIYVGAKV